MTSSLTDDLKLKARHRAAGESLTVAAPTLEAFKFDDAVVRAFSLATYIWGVAALLVGLYCALQMVWPALTFGQAYLTFGRLRPLHTNAAIFAFAGNALFAAIYYSTQRLCKAGMWSDKLSRADFWGWQAIIVAAALTLPVGITQSKEYAELEWPIAVVWLGFFGTNFSMTLKHRRERHMYAALWFYIATIVTATVLHVFNNLSQMRRRLQDLDILNWGAMLLEAVLPGAFMSINAEMSVGALVVDRPSRARVFEKLGIDYCCGGKKPLQQVCRERDLDVAAVVGELEREQSTPHEATRNWASASLTDLCDHIEQTHHHYLKEELPRLVLLTTKVANRHGDKRPALIEVQRVFAELKAEMDAHMTKEEGVLFPLCRRLDAADELPPLHCGSVGSPIDVMMQEHEHAGDALAQIRCLTDNFTCPADACNTYRALFEALGQLERDLHEHVHKENNMLFPKALRRERLLLAVRARS